MEAVEDGTLEKSVASPPAPKGFLGKLERLFLDNFPYSLAIPLVTVFVLVFLLVPGEDDMRPKYVPEGVVDENDGDEIQDDDKASGANQNGEDANESKKDK